jgi:hypothetical protein
MLIRRQCYHGDYVCSLGKFVCQVVMGWISALKYLLPDARGACGHVLLDQAVNAAAS